MSENQSVNIRQISRDRAEQVGYYRFLENQNVSQSELIRSISDACSEQVEGLHVLAISDSSEINLNGLLTTHQVLSLEQALKVIEWYRWRWRIEQLFATVKQAGLNIEATQLESIGAIERLTILALSVAVRILQLLLGRENTDLDAACAFSEEQQQCLEHLAPTLEGHTQLQKNPYPRASLPWATWLIARLGGWSGYRSQRPPGMPTLVKGLRKFESLFLGWKLAQTPLVCTP